MKSPQVHKTSLKIAYGIGKVLLQNTQTSILVQLFSFCGTVSNFQNVNIFIHRRRDVRGTREFVSFSSTNRSYCSPSPLDSATKMTFFFSPRLIAELKNKNSSVLHQLSKTKTSEPYLVPPCHFSFHKNPRPRPIVTCP